MQLAREAPLKRSVLFSNKLGKCPSPEVFCWSLMPAAASISRLDKDGPAVDYSHLHERSLLQAVFAASVSNRVDHSKLESAREAGGAQDGL